ncbi:MAG: bifunctional ADP-dependent NAD(P)H-hydrate dehydratase/NAD(P)H-hydrate epimerase [Flavobacteriales bacterium CG_4_10_14_0_2_um_filter_32_8]|nr:MAG: bifunctional ADP-dependent NAD(P)H-hydrate dehydratase/NAD(P)H-hydrate epimerase [Flavobacteriales bacterium CG_4_10_14_0_2_um_filter_32_8]PJB14910.1 MAG: bifunctional ADP-dependent NAD(P)H-hydrate dehydratase/NAD(P)H-hydrate epimerase [Flavobacteriales bacterium CG_4_9_14_3_um_filter_32_8]
MKILTAQQTREADAYTIKNELIKSIDLMERASRKCADWLMNKFDQTITFTFFCGVGNNGGDGLAIARMLKQNGYEIMVFGVCFSEKHTPDFDTNLSRIKTIGINPILLTEKEYQFILSQKTVVIDAIFGSGLARPIDGFVAEIIYKINNTDVDIIAIDIPSGLFSTSNINNNLDNIIHANYTLTFQQPKLTMMFPENFRFVGEFEILDIGLHQEFLNKVSTSYYYLTLDLIKTILHQREKFSHKGNYGHALLIAGSKGKMGAGVLSARACLRTGVGLLTVLIPKNGVQIIQTTVPEAMCIGDAADNYISVLPDITNFDGVGIGPGLGKEKPTQNVLKLLIQNSIYPLVIDADAINIISENLTWLSFIPQNSILTPHPKEFERLVGKWSTDEERLEKQKVLSTKKKLIVVLKGANTSISLPDGTVYFNSTGNAGMATGGSGDVLTGMLTSLLAQGYLPKEAAIFGVYLHGLAGDIAKNKVGINSLLASDIINCISNAYKKLTN